MSTVVRLDLAERPCLLLRFNATTKRFDDDRAVPYRKPIATPAEFLAIRNGGR